MYPRSLKCSFDCLVYRSDPLLHKHARKSFSEGMDLKEKEKKKRKIKSSQPQSYCEGDMGKVILNIPKFFLGITPIRCKAGFGGEEKTPSFF